MKKIVEWLHSYGIIVLLVLFLFGFMQTCNNRRQVEKVTKETKAVQSELDSLTKIINGGYVVQKDELKLMLEIKNLESAKMVLYDWNTVVRTVVRPDDRMHWYDQQIQKCEDQLDSIRNKKR
jgi:SNF family Na+-dependent transporter